MNQLSPYSPRYKPHIPNIPIQANRKAKPHRKIHSNTNASVPSPPPSNDTSINPRFRKHAGKNLLDNPASQQLSPIIPNGPISPQEAIETYSSIMTRYEASEILNFPSVYFLGNFAKKREPIRNPKNNFGFDTNDHIYRLIIGDHLAYRFEVLSSFGSGAFGQVVKALDHKTGQHVAIKIIVNTEQMHEQGQIEAKILARLNRRSCPNVVRAYDFFIFRSHICITFEILGRNLYELIQLNQYQPFPMIMVRTYALQIFQALEGIHDAGIIHCDIKPENILISNTQRNVVKIIDFGSGCFDGRQKYEYIQSRFYRAPEVVLGIQYGPPMDIWSAALVIVEMLTGRALFPCNTEHELLVMITEMFGPPPIEVIKMSKRRKDFFDLKLGLKPIKGRICRPSSNSLQSVLNINDPNLIDFLTRCLAWNQKDRMTAKEALQHPWIQTKVLSIQDQQPAIQPSSTLPDLHNSQKVL
ncbi:hypothetical protein M9Y10_009858 [Tritrichomonas musculus]|uniref:dual-specificity kinase n=1 Tax=Tritrichomonas musculus TaxID=1915356 RepID=A0ABR2IPN3_9EUKA